MADSPDDGDVRLVIDSERALLTPEVRRTPERVERLLHPAFFEFGSSGRRWERDAMIAAMAAEPPDGDAVTASELTGVRLADDVILVTYRTESSGRTARRSSLWLRTGDGSWRLYFHQGSVPS